MPNNRSVRNTLILALVLATIGILWLCLQNAIPVASDLNYQVHNRTSLFALISDLAILLVVVILLAWFVSRQRGVSGRAFFRRLLQVVIAFAYLIICMFVVPQGKWDWPLALQMIPITIVTAYVGSSMGWFLVAEYTASVVILTLGMIFSAPRGLMDFLGGSWLIILGAGVLFVGTQLPIYLLVRRLQLSRA